MIAKIAQPKAPVLPEPDPERVEVNDDLETA